MRGCHVHDLSAWVKREISGRQPRSLLSSRLVINGERDRAGMARRIEEQSSSSSAVCDRLFFGQHMGQRIRQADSTGYLDSGGDKH
jgi:hypothetical protein